MRNYFQRFTFLILFLFILASFSFAQDKNFPTPREEKLLNGLKVLIWSQPNTGRVSVNLRIHSGTAFDPKDKEGTVALLSDILFPDIAVKKFFEEELEGKLEIISTFDYVQINATAKADQFLTILETISPAITNPQINKENLDKVKEKRLERLAEMEKDPNYIADQAFADRLFGDFPYGRPENGTSTSINNIDFADLIFSKQRFLTADNATLTITGDVNSSYAYRAARRLLGGWQKSLRKIPATFRLPSEPDEAPLVINIDEKNVIENRYGVNSFSRKDKDYFATEILTNILDERFKKVSEQKGLKNAYVKNNANFLRGNIVFSKTFEADKLPVEIENADTANSSSVKNVRPSEFITKLFTEKITQSEFDKAKGKVLADLNNMSASDFWLEIGTYKLESISDEFKKAKNTTISDVQRVSLELSKNKIVDVSVSSVSNEVVPDSMLNKDPKDPK